MELWNVEIALLIAIRLLPNENHCGLNIVLHVVYFASEYVDMAMYSIITSNPFVTWRESGILDFDSVPNPFELSQADPVSLINCY